MPRAWSPSGVRSGSSPGRASTKGVRGAPGGSPGPLGLDSVCSSRYVVMLRKVLISLSRMACWRRSEGYAPEASWTAIRSPRTSTRGVEFLPAALLPGTPCTGGNFPLPICWVCRLESVYGIARQFLSDEGVLRSRTGVDPGAPRRRRTVGKTASNLPRKPLESHRETTGKPLAKLPGNCREKPRFGVTFASLNKGREWLEKASPASFFGPWGGLP